MLYVLYNQDIFYNKIKSKNKIVKKYELNLFQQKIIECLEKHHTSNELYNCINDHKMILLNNIAIKSILSTNEISDVDSMINIIRQNLSKYIVSKYANIDQDYYLLLDHGAEMMNYTKYNNVKEFKEKTKLNTIRKRRQISWK